MTQSHAKISNLTSSIVHELGLEIVTGKYADGVFPKEIELAQKFGAARTVTREAVKMLTSKGLVVARPRRGTRVQPESQWNLFDPDVLTWLLGRPFSRDLLIEFTQIRMSIEPGAAALAAIHASETDRTAISQALTRMFAAEKGEDDSLASDIAFHVAVLEATGNRFFRHMHDMVETALRFSIRQTNAFEGGMMTTVMDHKRVADAILAGNPQEAERRMRELVQIALSAITKQRSE